MDKDNYNKRGKGNCRRVQSTISWRNIGLQKWESNQHSTTANNISIWSSKTHKVWAPLRTISPTSELTKFLSHIVQPLKWKTSTNVKNSLLFVKILKTVRIKTEDQLAICEVRSLYTNALVREALTIIKKKIADGVNLLDRTDLPVNITMLCEELLFPGKRHLS